MELRNFFSPNAYAAPDKSLFEYKDFPFSLDDVWISGVQYNVVHDIQDLRSVIRSKIWLSYRSGFPKIGGTGPTDDKNWGCMLRCGQMVMAEALICKHLGRNWTWIPGVVDPVYAEILKMFQDKTDAPYSIHQIAQMGVSEGKSVGHWFGPNTVAQVLRKLSNYDSWSSLAVHVAFDNTVIVKDIKTLCTIAPEPSCSSLYPEPRQTMWYAECNPQSCPKYQSLLHAPPKTTTWRPMLLFIPLRLGLAKFNPIYSTGLKNSFMMKQSIGILGGKPRHAVWFVGCAGNEFVCLDPHIIQTSVDLDVKFDDASFHLPYGGSKRMPIADIDPSLSLCFFFESESDFDEWCLEVKRLLNCEAQQPLFEMLAERPYHWPPLELRPDLECTNCSLDYCFVEPEVNLELSDDDFEIC